MLSIEVFINCLSVNINWVKRNQGELLMILTCSYQYSRALLLHHQWRDIGLRLRSFSTVTPRLGLRDISKPHQTQIFRKTLRYIVRT